MVGHSHTSTPSSIAAAAARIAAAARAARAACAGGTSPESTFHTTSGLETGATDRSHSPTLSRPPATVPMINPKA